MKRLAYCSPFVPAEWVAAHGIIPFIFRPEGDDRVGPVNNSAGTCAYMRAFVNEALEHPEIDAVAVTTVCDQMRRSMDLLDDGCDKPFFLMHVPATWQTSSSFEYYVLELKRLGRFMVRLGGEEPSPEKLAATMRDFEQRRLAILANPSFQMGNELTLSLQTMFEGGAPRVPGKSRTRGIPIGVVGGPLTIRDLKIFKTIEDHGGAIVLDATENGEGMLPGAFNKREIDEDPLGALASAYFLGIPEISKRPNSELFARLKKQVRQRSLRGVVLVRYVFCDCWHAEVSRLSEWLDVPVVDIDFTGEGAENRNATRVAAFMEALK